MIRWLLPGLTALAACTSALGIEQLPPGTQQDAGPDAPVWTYFVAECQTCTEGSCADQAAACLASPDCVALYQCLVQCPLNEPSCRAACEKDTPTGVADAAAVALDSCRRGSCLDECLGISGLVKGLLAEGCGSCGDDKCASQERACVQDVRCERAFACQRLSLDPANNLYCLYDVVGEQLTTSSSLVSCVASRCALECEVGHQWQCVGRYSWGRPATSDPLLLQGTYLKFSLGGSPEPFAGLQVDVCAGADAPGCDEIADSGVTDELGQLTSELPVVLGAGFVGHWRTSGQGSFPMVFYAGRPIIRSELQPSLNVFPSPEAAYALATLRGTNQDPALGYIAGQVWDCLGFAAVDATITIDDAGIVVGQTTVGYLTGMDATGVDGAYGVFNVQPGRRTLTAWSDGTERAHYTAWVEAGCATVISLYPDPG